MAGRYKGDIPASASCLDPYKRKSHKYRIRYFLATVLVSSSEETRKVPSENVSEYTPVVKRFDFR